MFASLPDLGIPLRPARDHPVPTTEELKMSAIQRCASFAILCLAALGVSAQGQAFLNGTWRFDMSKTKFEHKPFLLYTSQGWFHCVSCTTPYDVQADGQDHPTADKSFDTYAVTL